MVSVVFFAIFIVVSCIYADKVGRKKVLFVVTAATFVFSFFTPFLLVHSASHVLIFLCLGFVLMGGLFGPLRRLPARAVPGERALLRRRSEL